MCIGSNCVHSFATDGHVQRVAASLLSLHIVVRGMFAEKNSVHLPGKTYFGNSRTDSGFADLGQLLVTSLTALVNSQQGVHAVTWKPSVDAFIGEYRARPVGWTPLWEVGNPTVTTLPNGRVVKFTRVQWEEVQRLATVLETTELENKSSP